MVIGRVLVAFFDPKAIRNLESFLGGVFAACPDFDGTSTGFRRDFGRGISSPNPPRVAPLSRAEGSYYDRRNANTR